MTIVRCTVLGVLVVVGFWGCSADQQDPVGVGMATPEGEFRTTLPDEVYEMVYNDILEAFSWCENGSADPAICAKAEESFELLKKNKGFIDWLQRKGAEEQASRNRALVGALGIIEE